MTVDVRVLVPLAIVNVPVYVLLGVKMFSSWSEIGGVLLDPRPWRSRLVQAGINGVSDDRWARFKLLFWALICGATVPWEYGFLSDHAPGVVHFLAGLGPQGGH